MIEKSHRREPQAVSPEFGGKWIAWDDAAERIVASGATLEDVRRQALQAGVKQPGLEFVPLADRAFVGGL